MSAIRMLFLSMAAIIFLGIWVTGFNSVHWLLYVPVIFLTFAGITGICPGYIFWSKLGFKSEPLSLGLAGRRDEPPSA